MKNDGSLRFLRRTFLAGAGATAAGALIRPLLSQAAGNNPQRILIIHRPCGTILPAWFPASGGVTDWVAGPLLTSFNGLRNDMVVVNGVNAPRIQNWLGDKHGAGMLAMMSPSPKDPAPSLRAWPILPGTPDSVINDTNAKAFTATDQSIEQLLLSKVSGLQGAAIPSVQLTSSLESADKTQPHCLRVVSYSKDPMAAPGVQPTPLWPEARPNVAFTNIFGTAMTGMSADAVTRAQAQNKSVLDFITNDLNRLKPTLPASQAIKMDAHLTAIRELENKLTGPGVNPTGRTCAPPTLAPLTATTNDASYKQRTTQQLQLIKTALQCDLTRVITFTYGFGNSGLHFYNIFNDPTMFPDKEGHHDISHNFGKQADGVTALSQPVLDMAKQSIDKFYADQTAGLLMDMKNTPDGADGSSLLDNTLVVYWNECSDGNSHGTDNMPVALFGGKFMNLQGGKYLKFTNRYMSDFWVTTAQKWNYNLPSYGDAQWNTGALAGIYG